MDALDGSRTATSSAVRGLKPFDRANDPAVRATTHDPESISQVAAYSPSVPHAHARSAPEESDMRTHPLRVLRLTLLAACTAGAAGLSLASSHREAPFITTAPKVDGTDFYMFRSYEGVAADGNGGRSDFVTLIANYQPLQGPYGGPN